MSELLDLRRTAAREQEKHLRDREKWVRYITRGGMDRDYVYEYPEYKEFTRRADEQTAIIQAINTELEIRRGGSRRSSAAGKDRRPLAAPQATESGGRKWEGVLPGDIWPELIAWFQRNGISIPPAKAIKGGVWKVGESYATMLAWRSRNGVDWRAVMTHEKLVVVATANGQERQILTSDDYVAVYSQ